MTSAQRRPGVRPGRPAVADLVATLLVATAVVLSILWLTDLALTDWSTRMVAGVVLALGYVGCMTTRTRMAEVYGARGRPHAPLAYVVAASSAGAIALVSGLVAVIWAAETMLVVLVAACVVLWAMATARHLVMRDEPTGRLRPRARPRAAG